MMDAKTRIRDKKSGGESIRRDEKMRVTPALIDTWTQWAVVQSVVRCEVKQVEQSCRYDGYSGLTSRCSSR